MPQFKTSRLLHVPPDVAYEIAADVESYKNFLPLMHRSTIRGGRLPVGSGEKFLAELVVAYEKLGLKESFVSEVVTDPIARTVTATSAEGPMKSLSTSWEIREVPGGSEVSVKIDYAFKNKLMQIAFAGMMDLAAAKIMKAFENRALEINAAQNAAT